MREHRIIRAGGVALIVGAAAFLAVFSYLAARFDYQAILDGSAETELPKLLARLAPGSWIFPRRKAVWSGDRCTAAA